MWNDHRITLGGTDHTKDSCEGWNNSFCQTLGHDHPSVLRHIDHLRDYAAHLLQAACERLPKKRQKNCTRDLKEKTFQPMCIEVKPNYLN